MTLLRKKKTDGTYFDFDKILRKGYEIDEQENEIAKKQMANGKRKKIVTSYVDCEININIGLWDNVTYQKYKPYLNDGEYQYWSYRDNKMKNANFIITLPPISTEYAYDNDIGIEDLSIKLEKSSDIS
jgi:hypothetical protein